MTATRWFRGVALAAWAATAGCGGGPPEDPMMHLQEVCDGFAAASCQKTAECAPPADSTCVTQQTSDCLASGTENGPKCVSAAAAALDSCAAQLKTKTCASICQPLTTGGIFCFDPCIWICPV